MVIGLQSMHIVKFLAIVLATLAGWIHTGIGIRGAEGIVMGGL